MSLPNKDEVKGKIDEASGAVKEAVGHATGDPVLENEGADQRASGCMSAASEPSEPATRMRRTSSA